MQYHATCLRRPLQVGAFPKVDAFRRARLLTLACLLILPALFTRADTPIYQNPAAPLETRVDDLLTRLTQDEKLSLLSGADNLSTPPVLRLGIPAMRMADAGAGVRGIGPANAGPATNFGCGVLMASTWDTALVSRVAAAIGVEARNKGLGSQVLLGPAVNIQRSPLGGRNGEYFTEDPFLDSRLAVAYIDGMQSTLTAACIKHFAANNEEIDRDYVNVHVGERALREIYLPAFAAGVQEAHVWTVMSSYNQVNGHHSSSNPYLLTDILRKDWSFDGLVMSDWGGVHATAATLNAGNDLEMPGPRGHLAPAKVAAALAAGELTQATIDTSVRRTLRTLIRVGLLDGPMKVDASQVNTSAHQQLARELAEQSIVLLKNDDALLPIDPAKIHSIALVGQGVDDLQTTAEGSPAVTAPFTITPRQGITTRAGDKITLVAVPEDIRHHATPIPDSTFTTADKTTARPGLTGEYFANADLQGTPLLTRTDKGIDFDWPQADAVQVNTGIPGLAGENFSVRWTGKLTAPATGKYLLSFSADDGCRLYLDGKKLIDHWVPNDGAPVTAHVQLEAGHAYDLRAEYYQGTGRAKAVLRWVRPGTDVRADEIAAAQRCDMAIVFVSTAGTEGEGHDRPSMGLPGNQDALIQAVAAVNKHTLVVLNNGTPVDMRAWIDSVPGVLETWFPGMEAGNALASILFGDVNPSGKLPTTFGEKREDYPDFGHFPGVKGQVDYAEGIYIGYRHFDQARIAPLFPFGYGLSYTTFAYGPLRLSSPTLDADGKISVSLTVTNTGKREGREVVELYIHDLAPKIDKPIRELKAFAKVDLAPGESKPVLLALNPRDFAYFDVAGKQWKADAGDYEIEVGASSRDIRQKAVIHLANDVADPVLNSRDFTTQP